MRRLIFICTIILLVSCDGETNQQTKRENPVTTYIQPFANIPAKEILFVFDQIKKVYPNTILVHPIPIPVSCWYAPRNRYKADSIIHYLSATTSKRSVTIGITNKDISTTKNNISDFGIIGLG